MKKPFVIICIVNWNRYNDTSECLHSLMNLNYSNYSIVVIDNGSSDHSVDKLKRQFPKAIFIENTRNLGFAGGTNVGIRYALYKGADYIFLLNNDTFVDPDVLQRLIEAGESDKRIGIIGPAVYCWPEKSRFWSAGMQLVHLKGKKFPQYVMRGKGEIDRGQYGTMEDIDMINACALLAKREVVENIGLLDEHFFLYNEDSDWNDRAAKAGYRIVYVPQGRVWHKGSMSSGGECSPLSWFYTVRNQLFFYRKRTGWTGFPKLIIDYLKENYWLWKGFMTKMDMQRAKAVLDGVWCGVINRGGMWDKNAPWWLEHFFKRKMNSDRHKRR